jgi:glucose/arabinose dehydrogenase
MRPPRTLVRLSIPALVAASTLLMACGGTATSGPSEGDTAAGTKPAAPVTEGAAAPSRKALRLVTVATGLASPVYVAAPQNERNRLYVVEQAGRIRIVEKGKIVSTFLDIAGLVRSGGEQGLLSVAFHPDYASNGLFYVNYTDVNGDTRVVEYRSRSGGSPQEVRELLAVDQPYANHNGGQLEFGPDGLLYVGMGDGGSGGDPENRAQDMSTRLGKLLRLDVDRPGAEWQIVALGLRNPWRFSFDRTTGDLYIGDVGQSEWEEIDFRARSSTGLANYGWDVYEGTHSFEQKSPSSSGQLVSPIFEYSHANGCSVTGGYVYRGSKVAGAKGRYFFGDYCSGRIWSLVVKGGKATNVKLHPFRVDGLTSFGENAAGELFLAASNGTIYRLANG